MLVKQTHSPNESYDFAQMAGFRNRCFPGTALPKQVNLEQNLGGTSVVRRTIPGGRLCMPHIERPLDQP